MITPKDLAEACRSLAQDLEDGNGPELGQYETFQPNGAPCCVVGHALHRAGYVAPFGVIGNTNALYLAGLSEFCDWGHPNHPVRKETLKELGDANDFSPPENRARAVVEPLRKFADVLAAT